MAYHADASRGLPGELGIAFAPDQIGFPGLNVIEFRRRDGAVRQNVDLPHDIASRHERIAAAFDLTDEGLAAAKTVCEPFLALAFPLAPRRQFHSFRSRIDDYSSSLYSGLEHKQSGGEDYKWMAYIFAMRPGNRVRELRKARGLSQIDLAQKAGISQAAISQVENDQRPLTIDWMRTFARIFGCQPADLLCDDDNPDRLNDEERALLEGYRTASEAQRTMIARVAEPMQTVHPVGRAAA